MEVKSSIDKGVLLNQLDDIPDYFGTYEEFLMPGAKKQHTLRLPIDLFEQLEQRAAVMGRSLNSEITKLLEWTIERQVEADQAIITRMAGRQSPSTKAA